MAAPREPFTRALSANVVPSSGLGLAGARATQRGARPPLPLLTQVASVPILTRNRRDASVGSESLTMARDRSPQPEPLCMTARCDPRRVNGAIDESPRPCRCNMHERCRWPRSALSTSAHPAQQGAVSASRATGQHANMAPMSRLRRVLSPGARHASASAFDFRRTRAHAKSGNARRGRAVTCATRTTRTSEAMARACARHPPFANGFNEQRLTTSRPHRFSTLRQQAKRPRRRES